MIVDALIKLASSLLDFILSFAPKAIFQDLFDGLNQAWGIVQPVMQQADIYAPVHEGLAVLAGMYAFRVASLVWYILVWAYQKIPFIGH